jgi:hypothetical protein
MQKLTRFQVLTTDGSTMQYEPGGSTEGQFTTWRQCRKRVFVCWNMRGVHLLRQSSVHSDGNIAVTDEHLADSNTQKLFSCPDALL